MMTTTKNVLTESGYEATSCKAGEEFSCMLLENIPAVTQRRRNNDPKSDDSGLTEFANFHSTDAISSLRRPAFKTMAERQHCATESSYSFNHTSSLTNSKYSRILQFIYPRLQYSA